MIKDILKNIGFFIIPFIVIFTSAIEIEKNNNDNICIIYALINLVIASFLRDIFILDYYQPTINIFYASSGYIFGSLFLRSNLYLNFLSKLFFIIITISFFDIKSANFL